MTRRPLFWIVFTALGLSSAVTAARLFTTALPNISLDVRMSRVAAIRAAEELAAREAWGPDAAQSAASFGQVDPEVQTYVELEAGGSGVFASLSDDGVYHPYQWTVRRFAAGKVEGAWVRFAPSGTPIGFRLQLAEDDPGEANLDETTARRVAESASVEWFDLGGYRALESSSATLPGGRVDHAFVYERSGTAVGEARFRVRLVVAGDRLTEVAHFVHIPEAFSRRYADMRSANDAIALVSTSIFVLFFVLLGAGVGTALLLRKRWVVWRTPLVWGAVAATLFGLNTVNALPLSWMSYDTAVPATRFVLQQLAAAGAVILLGTPLLGFFFMAGESLGRRAFPHHLQQWRFWSPEVARSRSALGLTLGAYLMVGLELGYVVLFYLGTSKLEGWWSPADALVQPDLLATYLPSLQAVSISLFAALWEESVFRAVPIACAALMGARYGRKGVWIWGMVIVQAVVFAAGHANYPQLPAYARVVELSLPALAWGAVYVYFGLIPTILTHFLYDLALISSVLFASEAYFDQAIILLVASVPAAVVLWARRRGRATTHAPEWAYNRAWRASRREGVTADEAVGLASIGSPQQGVRGVDNARAAHGHAVRAFPLSPRSIGALGVVGSILWVGALWQQEPVPELTISRGEAQDLARAALRDRGLSGGGLRFDGVAVIRSGRTAGHDYVFDEAGPEPYAALAGSYLADPLWVVRFVDWQADPADRIEEFRVYLGLDGEVSRIAHTLPEARPAPSLMEDNARSLARSALLDFVGDPDRFEEVSAEESSRPSRTDWDFTFRDRTELAQVDGEARVRVNIAGEEVVDVRRFVHTPEEWDREQRERRSRTGLFLGGLAMSLFLTFGSAAVIGIVVWSRGSLATHVGIKVAAVVFGATVLGAVSDWPVISATFSTAQPKTFQSGGAAFGIVLVALIVAASIGSVAALSHSWISRDVRVPIPPGWGAAVGMALAGLGAAAARLWPGLPAVPDYAAVEGLVPFLVPSLDIVTPFVFLTAGVLALAAARARFRGQLVVPSVVGFVIFAMGVLLVPPGLHDSLWQWAVGGLVGTLVVFGLVLLSEARPASTPMILGTMAMTGAAEAAMQAAYPGARVGGILAVALVGGLALVWSRALSRPEAPSAARPAGVTGTAVQPQSPAETDASVGSE